jgi:hypothetical protein
MEVIDPVRIKKARGAIKQAIARKYQTELTTRYNELTEDMKDMEFQVDAESKEGGGSAITYSSTCVELRRVRKSRRLLQSWQRLILTMQPG